MPSNPSRATSLWHDCGTVAGLCHPSLIQTAWATGTRTRDAPSAGDTRSTRARCRTLALRVDELAPLVEEVAGNHASHRSFSGSMPRRLPGAFESIVGNKAGLRVS
jgi:hypothetical protein